MAKNTKIEWATHTFNPWIGCTKVGPGCDNCYAKADFEDRRRRVVWGAGQPRSRTSHANWQLPLRWNAQHDEFFAIHGHRQRVFCASLADVFDNSIDPQWRTDLFELIRATPNLDWLLLTKRIGNAKAMIDETISGMDIGYAVPFCAWPYPNVWIGATIVNQEEADRDIPKLLAVPAAKRFLSMEPSLGPVTVFDVDGPIDVPDGMRSPLDWVIVGGESGPDARPMNPDWARSLRDQCEAAGVPFLFKQWGEYIPYEHSAQPPYLHSQHGHEIDGHSLPDFESDDDKRGWVCDWADQILARKVGKKVAGRMLDGRTWDGFPT